MSAKLYCVKRGHPGDEYLISFIISETEPDLNYVTHDGYSLNEILSSDSEYETVDTTGLPITIVEWQPDMGTGNWDMSAIVWGDNPDELPLAEILLQCYGSAEQKVLNHCLAVLDQIDNQIAELIAAAGKARASIAVVEQRINPLAQWQPTG